MSTSILKTHYRRSATILTSEQIKEIRHLKNKVPVYMIVKKYHINKNRVHDIWNGCEHFQQNGNHFLEELRKVQSISSVPPSENSPQDKENNHPPISGSLKSLDESISREISRVSLETALHFPSPLRRVGLPWIVYMKSKKRKRSHRNPNPSKVLTYLRFQPKVLTKIPY